MSPPKYMGITEFMEGMAGNLADAPLRPHYRSVATLRRDIAQQVQAYVQVQLAPLGVPFKVWQQGASPGGLEPVLAFGRDFWPDVAVEVSEIPTIAVAVKLIAPRDDGRGALSFLLGETIIYTRVYPAVLAFALDRGSPDESKHWWDPDLRAELWERYHIRLIIRR